MNDALIRLHPEDNVLVARDRIPLGEAPIDPLSLTKCILAPIMVRADIPAGHKVATVSIAKGESIIKYGTPVGKATEQIHAGDWVHTHNVSCEGNLREYEFATELRSPAKPSEAKTFQGYRRDDGRVGTRNYVAVISTVNCSATASKYVAQAIEKEVLQDYPQVDGIIALTHKAGCAFDFAGEDHQQLTRTLAGFAKHPNIGGYLILGLGCETAQPSYLANEHQLVQLKGFETEQQETRPFLNIQEAGGVAKTVERSVAAFKELLPEVNRVRREEVPLSELMLATECGGSDAYSGISANPVIGILSDLLVAHGGTSILSEVPEIFGGEHLLTRRAVNREVGEKLLERVRWWQEYAAKFGASIDNNPSVGNKQGGLTTIFEKSLGAIAKGGSSPLVDVYKYAEPVTKRGFVVMDTPGYDPASVTGMVAGGANMVVFSTGRGSCFGCKPVPSLKIASNSSMYEHMLDDMDFDAGRVLSGASVEELGAELLEQVIRVASGEQTKSEAQGIGDEEFCPWFPGPIF